MEEPQLDALVERCRRGEPGAWDALLGWLLPRTVRLLRGLCRDEALAEDLAQDTAEQVLRKLDRYEAGTRFRAWAATVAVNRYRDWLRKSRLDGAPEAPPVGGDPAAASEETERHGELWRQVLALREEERTVLCMKHLGGLTFQEIARALGRPLGTVLSLQHRALARLGKTLGR